MPLHDVHPDAINALVYADHGAPFEILGPHPVDSQNVSIRALRPWAQTIQVVNEETGERQVMKRVAEQGLFEVTIPGQWPGLRYHFECLTDTGETETYHDPYAFGPILGELDLHLLGEGRHLESYEKLGAHLMTVDGVRGVSFAVWAPNARRMSIVGAFNRWDARAHPMRMHPGGVWELFIPDLEEWTIYKYDVRSHHMGYHGEKSDPYGFYSEMRPKTASIVVDLDRYQWSDAEWMTARAETSWLTKPMSIYEVHLGSWRRNTDGTWKTYRQLADELTEYAQGMGYTHLELLPVTEHPFDGSWGYQATGYFAITSRFGTPEDFMYFVDQAHQKGLGVILDWVPAHFPKDGYALSYFDGTHLYDHEDARLGEHPDWGTYIFNYGRNEVRNFLLSSALFWLKRYHLDGLRVDAVSSMIYLDFGRKEGEWLPNQFGGRENLPAIAFLRELNEIVHRECPGAVTIAEESTSWPMVSRPTYLGGLGFTFKWDMGWMHDTLDYFKKEPIHRRWHHNSITFSMAYAFSENFVLPLSHDEVVHMKGSMTYKMAGDWWQKFANLRLLYGYQYTHPGKKLNFMGNEIGQWSEWSETRQIDWFLLDWPMHRGLQDWLRDLNKLYKEEPSLYEQETDWRGFRWIEPNDADQSTYSYIRFATDPADFLVVVMNCTPIVRHDYRIGVPEAGYYREVLNSDATVYGGGNVGNSGGVQTEGGPMHGLPHALRLTVPPLGIVILKIAR